MFSADLMVFRSYALMLLLAVVGLLVRGSLSIGTFLFCCQGTERLLVGGLTPYEKSGMMQQCCGRGTQWSLAPIPMWQ